MIAPLLLLASTLLVGGEDPARQWRTLSTTHLDVHFPDDSHTRSASSHADLEPEARRAAAAGEAAVGALEVLFGRPLGQRIQVVLDDDHDTANGLTLTLPYNLVVLYPYPPESRSELAHHVDWRLTLLAHEFAHVFQLEHAPGVWGVLNAVLGRTFQPGHLHPDWMIEGLAVLAETWVGGRGRVGYGPFEAILRAQALEGHPFSLSDLGAPVVRPPRGQSAYLYGQAFLSWVAERYGWPAVRSVYDGYDRWWVPFFHDVHARRAFDGHTWTELYDQWLSDLRARVEPLRGRVETGRRLTFDGEYRHFPLRDGDGWILLRGSGHHEERLVRVDDEGHERRLVRCLGGCGRPSLDRTWRRLFFTRGDVVRLTASFDDLYVLDLGTGLERRLTEGARLHDASWCAARGTVLAARTVAATTHLVELEPITGTMTTRASFPPGVQVSDPTCAPDGRTAYLIAPLDGEWDAWALDLADGTRQKLTDDAAVERDLALAGDDGALLFSVPDADGTSRVRWLDPATGAARWLTTTRTADYYPTLDPTGTRLAFVRQHAGGLELYEQPFEGPRAVARDAGATTALAEPPASSPTPRSEGENARPRDATATGPLAGDDPAATGDTRAYSAWPSVLPAAWVPTWYLDSSGLSDLGLELSGSDAAGRHGWTASTDVTLPDARPGVMASYAWAGTWPTLFADAWFAETGEAAWYNDGLHDWPRWLWGGAVGASLAVPRASDRWSFSVRYGLTFYRRANDPQDIDFVPDATAPWWPKDQRAAEVRAAAAYDCRRGFAYGIGAEEGFAAQLSLTWRDPWLGGQDRLGLVRADLDVPVGLPWPRHAVLDLHWRGGVSLPWRGDGASFTLGGPIYPSVLQQLVNQEYVGDAGVKGYPPGARRGRHYQRLTTSLDVPLWRIDRGWDVRPVALTALSVSGFCDAADAFDGRPFEGTPLVGVGGELVLGTLLFYTMPFRLVGGYAHGLTALGEGTFYLYLGL